MLKIAGSKQLILGLIWTMAGCVTLGTADQQELDKPPVIHAKTPPEKALEAALTYGGDTLVEVKRHFHHQKKWPVVSRVLRKEILANHESWQPNRLINAVHLYQVWNDPTADEVFRELVKSENPLARQLGWQVGAAFPSVKMASAIEKRLTDAIMYNELPDILIPKVAEAVGNNRLTNSYTVMRQGLFQTGNVDFVRTMIKLKPGQASRDFMEYLARAPVEELRQLTLASVDVYSVLAILDHMTKYPPQVSGQYFDHLFFYAISRNRALAAQGRQVLDAAFNKEGAHAALLLARLPTWVQVAFVESAKRQMTPATGLFLAELKKATAQKSVIEEISAIQR